MTSLVERKERVSLRASRVRRVVNTLLIGFSGWFLATVQLEHIPWAFVAFGAVAVLLVGVEVNAFICRLVETTYLTIAAYWDKRRELKRRRQRSRTGPSSS